MHWFSKVLKVARPKFRKNRVNCTSRQLVSHYIYCLSFFFPSPTYFFPSILNSSVFNIHWLLASLFLLRFQNNWSNVYLPLFLLLIFLTSSSFYSLFGFQLCWIVFYGIFKRLKVEHCLVQLCVCKHFCHCFFCLMLPHFLKQLLLWWRES